MMDKPTEEQIKEFWERCGYTDKLESIQPVEGQKEGKLVYVSPPIDLNSLFGYAVPKVSDKPEVRFRVHWKSKNELTCELWRHSPRPITQVLEGSVEFEDKPTEKHYALALFWALWQALKEGMENG